MTDASEANPARSARPSATSALVLRNAAWLVLAQLAATPLSVAVQAVMARHLGPADFGFIYLAGTLCGLGFLVVDFGQSTALPGLVARDRTRTGELLGTSLAWRAALSVAIYLALSLLCRALGLGATLEVALGLVALASGLGALARGIQDAVRGLERTDLAAWGLWGQQLLTALLVIPTLLLGGRLVGTLLAQAAAAGLSLLAVVGVLRWLDLGRLACKRSGLEELLRAGGPFLLLGLALAVQPNVDALLLARLTPPAVVGWHAAALRLFGALMLPASSLVTALYPTLCRLHAHDPAAYRLTARAGLRTAAVLAVPLAVGCGLYPDLGVWIFNRGVFGPSEGNLRLLAPCLLLMYYSMACGCCLSAAGRQRAWSLVQLGAVAVGATADWLLIPRFQAGYANGGLGVCVSLTLCEVLLLASAVAILPAGVLDRSVGRTLVFTWLGGGAMVAAAVALRGANHVVGAAAAGAAYLVLMVLTRTLDRSLLRAVRSEFLRRPGAPTRT